MTYPAPMPPRDPALLDLEMQLDLLVDNELPDDERRVLLDACAARPDGWRSLATRFLQRQAERTAVRQLITGVTGGTGDIPATYPFPPRRSRWLSLRAVAAVLIAAVLAGVVGSHYGTQLPPAPAIATSEVVPLPASILGSTDNQPLEVAVPVLNGNDVPKGYPFVNGAAMNEDTAARHLMIVPHGRDRALVFPVTTVNKAEVVY